MSVLEATYTPDIGFSYLKYFKFMFKFFSFWNTANLVLLKFLNKSIATTANQRAQHPFQSNTLNLQRLKN